MAFTEIDLTTIEAAIIAKAAGSTVKQVTLSNGMTEIKDTTLMSDLMRLRGIIRMELGIAAGTVYNRTYAGNGGRATAI